MTCARCIVRRTALCIAVVIAATAQAAVVGTTGAVQQLASPPATVMPNAFQDDNTIWIFTERTTQTLSTPLTVNINAPGSYSHYPASPTYTLPAGLTVDVYFMHFDPCHTRRRSGSVTFDTPILGVIVRNSQLFASNYLGAPGTTYPNSGTLLGLENGDDSIELSTDLKTITVNWKAGSPGDRIRIITSPTTVIPEPTSSFLFVTGLVATGAGLRRLRRR